MKIFKLIVLICTCMQLQAGYAQADTAYREAKQHPATKDLAETSIAGKYFASVQNKAEAFSGKFDKKTSKYLRKLIRIEEKMQRSLQHKDSALSVNLVGSSLDSLRSFYEMIAQDKIQLAKLTSGEYFSYLDTLNNSLSFLNKIIPGDLSGKIPGQLSKASGYIAGIESRLMFSEKIKEYLGQHTAALKDYLGKIPGMGKYIQQFSRQSWYVTEQFRTLKNDLADPAKAEKMVLALLYKIPAFKTFMSQNSFLSGLFPSGQALTGAGNNNNSSMQSRFNVQQAIQQRPIPRSSNPNAFVNDQLGAARAELDKLKNKLNELGGSNQKDIPDFKPNNQKTKKLKDRLQWGANMQFGKKVSTVLPATSDIGLQLAYKINNKSAMGIGMGYKIGLGSDIRNIRFSSQGISFRSYLDAKLKSGFFISGGYERSYFNRFSSIGAIPLDAWQSNALLGITKKVKTGKKMQSEFRFYYDFLHKQHIPITQPILFRFGYTFK